MSDEKFKLPRSSYEELIKVIKAYGRLNKPSTLIEVDQLAGIGKTIVSANNAFLLNIEIIEGSKTKEPTDKGTNLALALEHEMPEEISLAWRSIVDENDFLTKMVQAVNVRNGMEIPHLTNHIAYSAGEPKSSHVLTGARAVIDILIASGLVNEDGDKILPMRDFERELEEQLQNHDLPSDEEIHTKQLEKTVKGPINQEGVSLHIEVRVNVGPDDLDGLGEKLKKLIASISEETQNTE